MRPIQPRISLRDGGGDGGIRTLDRALQPYNGLANRRLQPLGHISGRNARRDICPTHPPIASVRRAELSRVFSDRFAAKDDGAKASDAPKALVKIEVGSR